MERRAILRVALVGLLVVAFVLPVAVSAQSRSGGRGRPGDWLVKYELKSVPEVSQVLSIGGDVKEYQILIDPNALLQYGLTVSDVAAKVRENNQNTGASFITRGQEEYIVRSIGLVQTLDDLRNTVVTSSGGVPILLSSLASVEILPAVRRGTALANGDGEKVVGMVLKLFGSNTAKVISDIESRIGIINRSLPDGVEIVPFYNQAAFIQNCYSTVINNNSPEEVAHEISHLQRIAAKKPQ